MAPLPPGYDLMTPDGPLCQTVFRQRVGMLTSSLFPAFYR